MSISVTRYPFRLNPCKLVPRLALIVAFAGALMVARSSNTWAASPDFVVVVGATGASEFATKFEDWANQLEEVGIKAGRSISLIRSDKSSFDQLEKLFDGAQSDTVEPLWVFLIGHGTFDGTEAKFNLTGKDLSAAQLSEWVAKLRRPLVLCNLSSCSAPFINAISGPNRIIVTATKSGTEVNATRLAGFLANSLGNAAADLDHDDEISIAEAVSHASALTQRFYKEDDRLATEHALLDDNGDGKGTAVKSLVMTGDSLVAAAKDSDGVKASRVSLLSIGKPFKLNADQIEQRSILENQLDELKSKKAQLEESDYRNQLETVLSNLARVYFPD